MAETKGISVQVPVDLHARAKAEQEQLELTMSAYIQQILEEHFTPKLDTKGGNDMSGNTRTLAFQVNEELFQRVKYYLSKHSHLTQKSFVIGLIEAELNNFEALEARITQRLDARDGDGAHATEEDGNGAHTTEEDGDGAHTTEEDGEGGHATGEDGEGGHATGEDGDGTHTTEEDGDGDHTEDW